MLAWTPPCFAQTFAQITELGPEHGIGPRITRAVARSRLSGALLFGDIGSKVTWFDASVSPARVFEFATDRFWSRVVFGEKDVWIEAARHTWEGQEMGLSGPRGVDITTMATLFVADAFNRRVAVFGFGNRALVFQGAARDDRNLGVPVDVAWDGGQDPRDERSAAHPRPSS